MSAGVVFVMIIVEFLLVRGSIGRMTIVVIVAVVIV